MPQLAPGGHIKKAQPAVPALRGEPSRRCVEQRRSYHPVGARHRETSHRPFAADALRLTAVDGKLRFQQDTAIRTLARVRRDLYTVPRPPAFGSVGAVALYILRDSAGRAIAISYFNRIRPRLADVVIGATDAPIGGSDASQSRRLLAARDMTIREVEEASRVLDGALVRGDTAVLARIYADGYVHVDATGIRTGKAERIAEIASGARRFQAVASIEESVYEVHGEVVVATSRTRPQQTIRGEAVAAGPRESSRVWMKRDGRWQVIFAQSTPITKP